MSVQHIVLFKYVPEMSAADEAEMLAQIRAFPGRIGRIGELRVGRAASDGRAEGYSHLMYMTVADEAALEAYQRHPFHEAFAAWVRAHGGSVLAFDYVLDVATVVL
ncbi:MAG: Dabb family protein [Acidimicrobiales bacterium]